jgi:hypothetical protein
MDWESVIASTVGGAVFGASFELLKNVINFGPQLAADSATLGPRINLPGRGVSVELAGNALSRVGIGGLAGSAAQAAGQAATGQPIDLDPAAFTTGGLLAALLPETASERVGSGDPAGLLRPGLPDAVEGEGSVGGEVTRGEVSPASSVDEHLGLLHAWPDRYAEPMSAEAGPQTRTREQVQTGLTRPLASAAATAEVAHDTAAEARRALPMTARIDPAERPATPVDQGPGPTSHEPAGGTAPAEDTTPERTANPPTAAHSSPRVSDGADPAGLGAASPTSRTAAQLLGNREGDIPDDSGTEMTDATTWPTRPTALEAPAATEQSSTPRPTLHAEHAEPGTARSDTLRAASSSQRDEHTRPDGSPAHRPGRRCLGGCRRETARRSRRNRPGPAWQQTITDIRDTVIRDHPGLDVTAATRTLVRLARGIRDGLEPDPDQLADRFELPPELVSRWLQQLHQRPHISPTSDRT